MLRRLIQILRKLVLIVSAPVYLGYFFRKEVGEHYGVGWLRKLRLIAQFRRNIHAIPTASHWGEHLRMAAEILKLSPSIEGEVIECGCYKGGSTANLSLVCALAGRKLIVCDSFEGLPEPDEADRVHHVPHKGFKVRYERGQYRGTLDEVRNNIERYGNLEACEFVPGFFETTLEGLDRTFVLVFLDVDLSRSLEVCLLALWPRLRPGALLFSHEAEDLGFVSLFFDRRWWQERLSTDPPGFIGSGVGLPLRVGEGTALGYAIKPRAEPS